MNNKIIRYIVGSFVVLFIIYNIFWYFGIYRIYEKYEKGFPEIGGSGVKIFVDEQEYQYSVKKPNYLRWSGNLAISEKNIEHAMIIWLGVAGREKKEGVIVTSDTGETKQIELASRNKALHSDEQELVDEYNKVIAMLYDKANNKWNLELD